MWFAFIQRHTSCSMFHISQTWMNTLNLFLFHHISCFSISFFSTRVREYWQFNVKHFFFKLKTLSAHKKTTKIWIYMGSLNWNCPDSDSLPSSCGIHEMRACVFVYKPKLYSQKWRAQVQVLFRETGASHHQFAYFINKMWKVEANAENMTRATE